MDELFSSLTKDFVDESKPIAQEVSGHVLELERAWTAGLDGKPLLRQVRAGLHTIKGNSSMMGLHPIERVAHALEDVCARAGELPPSELAAEALILLDGCDLLVALIEAALTGDVDEKKAEALVNRVVVAREAPRPAPVQKEARAMSANPAAPASVDAEEARGSARVQDRDVDELLELNGETIVGHTELLRLHGRLARGQFEAGDVVLMEQILTDLGRNSRQMRHRLLRVRLAPIGTLFRRFGRYVRDLAHERGQPIELSIEGADTAVDRAIIARLYEPLVHIVRNAVAHGIETCDDRVAAGKPAQARIQLSARLREGRVNVSVADDGRGLDMKAIAAKAEAQGFDSADLSERDMQRLIFQAGFSTATSVTNLAGRGVGLDVVASVVQSLGGSIDVHSKTGQGTAFTLDLPVTVSLQKALIFGVDSETFAVPTGFILDTMESQEKDMQEINRVLLVSWRNDFVRAADAGRLLGCQGLAQAWTRPYAIVLQAGNKRGALLVDWLSGVQEIVVKPLDDILIECRMVAGATVLGQGRVVPILDCIEVVRRANHTLAPEPPAKLAPEENFHVL